jgi:hypothetical protein
VVRAGPATWLYGIYALHAGYLRFQIHAKLMYYLLLFLCNNGSSNRPHCYVVRALPVLFHSPSSDHSNSICYGLQVMKLLIVRFYISVFHILSLRLKCPHLTLQNSQPYSSCNVRDQVVFWLTKQLNEKLIQQFVFHLGETPVVLVEGHILQMLVRMLRKISDVLWIQ